ncbi:hypothetical protein AYL99_06513 [Fonsecaea erecta]|uniref:Uncharacterized protein n=1 Tax=Fonsecaea erecta TaxID=1367422 RepID=A0A178ZJK2_9EURO|nr:hypothetical protein AYL99_06513 [Fonsecaea erecta]OAP59215.1 hypothetical protein AYL99_06513 [Fonsecaea erecta]
MTTTQQSITTQAPLTTFWTPPASCTTQLPILQAGSCSPPWCWTYNENDLIANWGAYTNWGYWTTSSSQVSSECFPPSSELVNGFTYSPAIGCPVGYTTAVATTSFNSENDTLAICCPKGFEGSGSDVGGAYVCARSVEPAGETMLKIAYGEITEYDYAGSSTYAYATTSQIGITVFTPPATATTTFQITATGIAMLVQSSLATTTPSSTSKASSDDKPSFSEASEPKVQHGPRPTSLTHGQMQDLGPKGAIWQRTIPGYDEMQDLDPAGRAQTLRVPITETGQQSDDGRGTNKGGIPVRPQGSGDPTSAAEGRRDTPRTSMLPARPAKKKRLTSDPPRLRVAKG